jgi:hypothetical protein
VKVDGCINSDCLSYVAFLGLTWNKKTLHMFLEFADCTILLVYPNSERRGRIRWPAWTVLPLRLDNVAANLIAI